MRTENLASFGKRLIAYLIDFTIVIITGFFITGIILQPFGGLKGVMGLDDFQFGEDLVKGAIEFFIAGLGAIGVLFLIYFICLITGFFYDFLMISFNNQATLGKKVMHLKVVKEDGSIPSKSNIFFRTVIKFITGSIFVFIWIICLFSDKKQTLHDKVMKTIVVEE